MTLQRYVYLHYVMCMIAAVNLVCSRILGIGGDLVNLIGKIGLLLGYYGVVSDTPIVNSIIIVRETLSNEYFICMRI